MGAVGDQGLL